MKSTLDLLNLNKRYYSFLGLDKDIFTRLIILINYFRKINIGIGSWKYWKGKLLLLKENQNIFAKMCLEILQNNKKDQI